MKLSFRGRILGGVLLLFAILQWSLNAQTVQPGPLVAEVRQKLLQESIFAPAEVTLNSGLARGLGEGLGEKVEPQALAGSALLGYWSQLAAREPQRVGALTQRALERMVESVSDPYTALLTPQDMAREREMMSSGRFAGVGVELAWQGGLVVAGVIPHSPAAQGGLQVGDFLQRVDGQATKELTFYRAGDLLSGAPGSQVKLDIVRRGRPLTLTLTRAALRLPEVESKMLSSGVGYLRLGYFGPQTAKETLNHLRQLQAQGLEKLVLDLRGNPGGDFQQGLQVAALFRQGELVKVQRRGGIKRMRNPQPPAYAGPLAILVDRGTASSGEIAALALQGQANVKVWGEKTFGKGLIQALYSMPGGYGLRLSTGVYLSREGESINQRGLTPDHSVASAQALQAALAGW